MALAVAFGASSITVLAASLWGARSLSAGKTLILALLCWSLGVLLAYPALAGFELPQREILAIAGRQALPMTFAACLAAAQVLIAGALLGLPLSPVQVIAGAFTGVLYLIAPQRLQWETFLVQFALPSVAACGAAALGALLLSGFGAPLRQLRRVSRERALVAGAQPVAALPSAENPLTMMLLLREGTAAPKPSSLTVGSRYEGELFGKPAQGVLERGHLMTAAAGCVLRGLVEGPVLLALVALCSSSLGMGPGGLGVVILGGAIGALALSWPLTRRLAYRLVELTPGRGWAVAAASLGTSSFMAVLGAAVPFSLITTAATAGIGGAEPMGKRVGFFDLALAWLVSPLVAAAIAGLCYLGLRDLTL